MHPPHDPSIPLPIRVGDYNIDGYPDLLLLFYNITAAPPGPFGGRKSGTQVKILENVACSTSGGGVRGCERGHQRGLRLGFGKGWEALDGIWDATGASWMDLDDDVGLVRDFSEDLRWCVS